MIQSRPIAALAAALALFGCSHQTEARRPNVVVISIDTLRADHLGAWGETRPTSPRLDRLCAESVVFRQAFSQAGLTAPAHMSLFTSLHPSVHGVQNSYRELEASQSADQRENLLVRLALDPDAQTLAQIFRDQGWRTAAFVGAGQMIGQLGFERGFELWDEDLANGMNGNRETLFDPARAARWLADHQAQPFFLFLHTYAPHAPYLPPAPWNQVFDPDYQGDIQADREAFYAVPGSSHDERYWSFWRNVDPADPADVARVRALYAGDVRYADDAVAQMLQAIEDTGQLENTILVVLSDHGEEFLEHGEFEHPGDVYRELVHVPLILRVPGFTPRTVDVDVRLIDVMPTLLELAGLPIPEQAEGTSLVPWLRAGTGPELAAFSEQVFQPSSTAPAGASIGPRTTRALRVGPWTYMARDSERRPNEALFDRRCDPNEQVNLAADPSQAEVLGRLRAAMRVHMARTATLAKRFGDALKVELEESAADNLRALGYTEGDE